MSGSLIFVPPLSPTQDPYASPEIAVLCVQRIASSSKEQTYASGNGVDAPTYSLVFEHSGKGGSSPGYFLVGGLPPQLLGEIPFQVLALPVPVSPGSGCPLCLGLHSLHSSNS